MGKQAKVVKQSNTPDIESDTPQGQKIIGRVETVNAGKLFGFSSKFLDFDIPKFVWEDAKGNPVKHPHVPDLDPVYEFNIEYLTPILWALRDNKKAWLSGHTGTGKSSLVKQVCALLNWPMLRVNFDSEITRLDLIGRDVLKREGNTTVSEFVDGVLPTALSGPYVLLCDEVDFIRPDVAYVFQRALEDEGLLITEDGGRMVHPHPWCRIIATANTKGQGDDDGIYQGAREQSLAFLDRFTCWVTFNYLTKREEGNILAQLVPDLNKDRKKEVLQYVEEHRRAFLDGRVLQPLSPRGIRALAESVVLFDGFEAGSSFRRAINCTILDKANKNDRQILEGLIDRIITKSN